MHLLQSYHYRAFPHLCNREIYKTLKYRTIVVTGMEIMNDEANKND